MNPVHESATMFARPRLLAPLVVLLLVTLPVHVSAAPASSEVLVVGGTPAGVAAAVAAAREGASVTLAVRGSMLGGILTDGMMDQWDLNLAPGGGTIQGGIFTEVHARLGDSFTPQAAASTFAALVASEPRITVRTGLLPASAKVVTDGDGRRVRGVAFAGADGRRTTILADEVIDATDNGDIAFLAGARFDLGRQDTGRDERTQAVTLMFAIRDVDWAQVAASYDPAHDGPGGATARRAWGYSTLLAGYVPLSNDVLVRDLNLGRESSGGVTVNAIDVLGIDGLRVDDRARARALSEREAPHLIAYLRTRIPGFESASVDRFASALYVRETRHFAGLERLQAGDVWSGRVTSDAIGLSSYPLDLHPSVRDERLAYAPVRHVYGVPLGTLVPQGFLNLVLASPSISASHIAAGSARVIPTTIEEGEAAGIVCALARRDRRPLADYVRDEHAFNVLRERLTARGVVLPLQAAYGVRSSGATRA